jgi:hypothetical protein
MIKNQIVRVRMDTVRSIVGRGRQCRREEGLEDEALQTDASNCKQDS